ncbi:MAG: hypothetical protein KUG64_10785 [Cycloclasticus sp.]|nr:hypothetical protein [Cycloclasticus sp.]
MSKLEDDVCNILGEMLFDDAFLRTGYCEEDTVRANDMHESAPAQLISLLEERGYTISCKNQRTFMKTDSQTIDQILNTDADKLLQGDRMMPTSLAEFINKRHKDLIPVDECYDMFNDAVIACKHHKEAFGFIPEAWATFMIDVKLNLQLKENPSKEKFMDSLLERSAQRLAWIARIASAPTDYDQEELLEMNMAELEEALDKTFPSEPKMEKGSFGRGFYKNAA